MRKQIIIVGIIVFSIITVGILAVSPILIDSRVSPNSQWIAFYASYLGGIFGGVVSGSLTLGGVYLTIRHQYKISNQEKAAKVDYILGELEPRFQDLNVLFKDTSEPISDWHIHEIKSRSNMLMYMINENKHIIETDFKLLKNIESVSLCLRGIIKHEHEFDDSNLEKLTLFEAFNDSIQDRYEKLREYNKSFH